ncbi:hypothetical protein [Streptomyces sp. SPB074]|uniref:hypothetical protein n=1 Tax=Streptomyces sp. (strain SPB074) TaxID=465543 RepID=UPI00017F1E62|nr:hypothetical protein [Streptomyces sp. SPB074]
MWRTQWWRRDGERRKAGREARARGRREARLAGLAEDLPDEGIGEDLEALADAYRFGSKPRCEEVEYLALLAEARE